MNEAEKKYRRARRRRQILGGALVLMVPPAWVGGASWHTLVAVLCGATILLVPGGRTFRPGVTWTADAVVCRYTPWYGSTPYLVCTVLPVLGICAIFMANDPNVSTRFSPRTILAAGVVILAISVITLLSIIRLHRLSLLHITPAELRLRVVTHFAKPPVVLPNLAREDIVSIEPKVVPVVPWADSIQIEITYRPTQSNHQGGTEPTESIIFGLHLTVTPGNLLRALTAWYEATDGNPERLLGRVEAILRGQAPAPA